MREMRARYGYRLAAQGMDTTNQTIPNRRRHNEGIENGSPKIRPWMRN